jgi:hypothetical protein
MPSTPPYPLEFRREAVRLLRSSGRSVPQLARGLDCSDTPKLSANSRGVRPARSICTASRRNSSGYAGRVFGTMDTILSRPAGASGQVSGKPGELQRSIPFCVFADPFLRRMCSVSRVSARVARIGW